MDRFRSIALEIISLGWLVASFKRVNYPHIIIVGIIKDIGRRMNNNGIVSLQQSNLWIVQVATVEPIPNELFSDFRNHCLCCDKSNCFKTCSRCKSVNFCSMSCQRAVWKSHKNCVIWSQHVLQQNRLLLTSTSRYDDGLTVSLMCVSLMSS